MKVGYARVSTIDQTISLQEDALKKEGCEKIFTDTISGAKTERDGLTEALEFVREGDILVCWKLDRLGRSLKHLIEVVAVLNERKVGFKSLTEGFDTTSNGGKLVFHIFGALAEFERGIIRERTNAGLQAARARGRLGGRPKKFIDPGIRVTAKKLYADKSISVIDICKTLKISRSTFYRLIID